nr:hypothetical protein [Paraburkholderia hospita]
MWVRRADLHVLEGEPIMLTFDFGRGRQRRARHARAVTRGFGPSPLISPIWRYSDQAHCKTKANFLR